MSTYEVTDRIRARMSASARARGETGFLHEVHIYKITVSGILQHAGRNKREAIHAFKRFQKWSKDGCGNAAGKTVRLLRDGKRFSQK